MKLPYILAMLAVLGPQANAGPKRLTYTYQFENSQNAPIATAFFDSLPEGLNWDSSFTPVTTGSLQVQATGNLNSDGSLVYNNAKTEARIDRMLLPPGISTLTLRTIETSHTGIIDNDATATPLVPGLHPLVAQAGLELYPEFFDVPLDKDVLLVIDASGSMSARFSNTNRFKRAIQEAVDAINALPATRKFSVITFNGGLHWSDGSNTLKLATTANKQAMTSALLRLPNTGATNYEVGLQYALNLPTRPKQIIFLSDGQPNWTNYFDELTTLKGLGIPVDTVGMGNIQSHLVPLQQMASLSGGTYRYVSEPESSGTLNPPQFSRTGGDLSYDQFPVALTLTNPNSEPNSRIRVSVNGGALVDYAGPISVGYNTTVEASVESSTPGWAASTMVAETYQTKDFTASTPSIVSSTSKLSDSGPQVTITISSSNPPGLTRMVYWFSSQFESQAVPYTGPFVLAASNWNTFAGEAMKEVKIYTRALGTQSFVKDSSSKDLTVNNETSAFLAQLSKDPLKEPEFSPNAGEFDYSNFPMPVTVMHPSGQGGQIWTSVNGGIYTLYSGPISVGYNDTISTFATPTGSDTVTRTDSPVQNGLFKVKAVTLATPTIQIAANQFTPSVTTIAVTLNNPNPSAISHLIYWFDGQDEATHAKVYTGPFNLLHPEWEAYIKAGRNEAKLIVRAVGTASFVKASGTKDAEFTNTN